MSSRHDLPGESQADVKADLEVRDFFERLGYKVSWDCHFADRWQEIYDGERMLIQIDVGVPLGHLLEDLPELAQDREGMSPSSYQVYGSLDSLQAICAVITAKDAWPKPKETTKDDVSNKKDQG